MANQCKKCRRAGQKLFLKGAKCYTPKCSFVRKPHAPGTSGQTRGRGFRRNASEYGTQMREKQKVKFNYGLREKQFVNYVKEASAKAGVDIADKIFEFLELRLDNAIFRMGLSDSRSKARQIASHGHIMVNGRRVNIPSYRLRMGDKITIRPQSAEKGIFQDIDVTLKKHTPPAWINLDKSAKVGEISGSPAVGEEVGMESSLNTIIEFYSR